MLQTRYLRTLEATAVLLFIVQSVRVLFSVLFGLIYDVIFAETVAFTTLGMIMACVIGAFLTPLAAPRRRSRTLMFGTAVVAALARVAVTINLPAVRLWSSIVLIAAGGVYAASLVRQRPRVLATGLALAFAADQLLRVAGDTFDVGLRAWWLPVQVLLSVAVCTVGWLNLNRSEKEPFDEGGIRLAGGLAVGAMLFLETSLLGFPNALARWSGVPYTGVAPLLIGVTLVAVLPSVQQAVFRSLQRAAGRLGLVLLALAGFAAGRVIGGAVGLAGMLAAQFLLVLFPFGVADPRRRNGAGVALALGFLLFLLLNFAFAFTFTYPYTIPAFREMGLPIALVAVAIASFPAVEYRQGQVEDAPGSSGTPAWHWQAVVLVMVVTAVLARPPVLDLKDVGPVRVGTYNMHYGYNTYWQLSLEAQARTIEESGADIVFLQEVDACRITSYGVDDSLWMAHRLGMQEVYGPALEGLSGIALLSRFPVLEADTQLLTSHLEQTGIVRARVRVGEQPVDARVFVGEQVVDAYGIWLGLEPEERARQLDDALVLTGGASPAVFGGDFNSTPDSPVYARIRATGFEDPFVVGAFDPAPTSPAIEPAERIDYVWMRGLDVSGARVLESLASDHRMVVVDLALR